MMLNIISKERPNINIARMVEAERIGRERVDHLTYLTRRERRGKSPIYLAEEGNGKDGAR